MVLLGFQNQQQCGFAWFCWVFVGNSYGFAWFPKMGGWGRGRGEEGGGRREEGPPKLAIQLFPNMVEMRAKNWDFKLKVLRGELKNLDLGRLKQIRVAQVDKYRISGHNFNFKSR